MTGKSPHPALASQARPDNQYRPGPRPSLGRDPGEPALVDNRHRRRCRDRPCSEALGAYLLLRSMRTLYPRVAGACCSAQQITEALLAHPCVSAVLYPGLSRHPGHAVAAGQMIGGYGGILSIGVRGGAAAAVAAAARVEVWKRATSRRQRRRAKHRRLSAAAGQDLPAKMAPRRASDLLLDREYLT
jgi:hypothetical protein